MIHPVPGFTLHPRGRFSLHSAAAFAEGFPGTEADHECGELRYAWAVDGDWRVVGVRLSQRGDAVRGELEGAPPADLARLARRDAERILSLDVDGTEFERVGRRDPVMAELQRRFAGLRPVLFYSPYEAAAWTIIGQRIRIVQAAAVKRRLADDARLRGRLSRSRATGHDRSAAARAERAQDRSAPGARRGRTSGGPHSRPPARAVVRRRGRRPAAAAGDRAVFGRADRDPWSRGSRRASRKRAACGSSDPRRLRAGPRRRSQAGRRAVAALPVVVCVVAQALA